MASIVSKKWFAVTFEHPYNRVYIFPAKSERHLRKYTKTLTKVRDIKPLKWSDLVYYFGAVLPSGCTYEQIASGPLSINQEGKLVTIWPI